MSTRELYTRKMQAQLDEWKADIAKLRARASGEKAEIQLAIQNRVDELERGIADAQSKLSDLANTSEEAWESVKKGMEAAWDSLKAGVTDARAKFKT